MNIEQIPSSSGNRGDLAHGRVKVCCGFYSGGTESGNCHRSGHNGLTGAGNGVTESLYFLAGFIYFGKSDTGGGGFLLQAAKLLLRLDDLTLESIIFVLTEIAVFELLFGLFLRGFQRIQFLFRRADGFLQCALFLRQQFCVGGVKLEETVYILQLALGVFDRAVYILQSFFQPCSITADLNGNALDSACRNSSPPAKGYKKSTDRKQSMLKNKRQRYLHSSASFSPQITPAIHPQTLSRIYTIPLAV